LPLSLTKYHAMKTYWENGRIIAPVLPALDGGGWSASRPVHFIPGIIPSVPIGYKAGWATAARPVRSLVAILTELSRLLQVRSASLKSPGPSVTVSRPYSMVVF
jgi:hypothetical protein